MKKLLILAFGSSLALGDSVTAPAGRSCPQGSRFNSSLNSCDCGTLSTFDSVNNKCVRSVNAVDDTPNSKASSSTTFSSSSGISSQPVGVGISGSALSVSSPGSSSYAVGGAGVGIPGASGAAALRGGNFGSDSNNFGSAGSSYIPAASSSGNVQTYKAALDSNDALDLNLLSSPAVVSQKPVGSSTATAAYSPSSASVQFNGPAIAQSAPAITTYNSVPNNNNILQPVSSSQSSSIPVAPLAPIAPKPPVVAQAPVPKPPVVSQPAPAYSIPSAQKPAAKPVAQLYTTTKAPQASIISPIRPSSLRDDILRNINYAVRNNFNNYRPGSISLGGVGSGISIVGDTVSIVDGNNGVLTIGPGGTFNSPANYGQAFRISGCCD